ncbi:unnamed protein product (macronuclear) [Paramecium tetraurelia]|uniref:Uncharacterized protein n=1 Tax=Paramecium tetraurelia TaxID=5888 RepID=A0BEY2_PARTE|nr:uncharacterized protein GSPATT00028134001 [Paramecium tetraurelia]CAK57099.1 unnamed protein product [Paramecium tetraurelia]|eukprot:XP_001424497.1 hypothetical protein (macronuclear) [Paramecium tetraurelia strain d4-2]
MFFFQQIKVVVLDNSIFPNKKNVNPAFYFNLFDFSTQQMGSKQILHQNCGRYVKLIVNSLYFLIILNQCINLEFLMQSIKRRNSEMKDPLQPHIEWLEEYLDLDTIEITVLQSIHKLNDQASLDCVIYISNIINSKTEFNIVYFQYLESQDLKQNDKNCFHITHFKQTVIKNPRQYINQWLKDRGSSPFLIKFQTNQNLHHQIQPTLAQAIQIADFIKSKSVQKNIDLLYDETISFINTMHQVNVK